MTRPYNVIDINGHIVPATRNDAIKKILLAIEEQRVAAWAKHRYTRMKGAKTCLCAIGALLSDTQLDQIRKLRLNDASIPKLSGYVGVENIEAITAMTLEDASHVQTSFDGCAVWDKNLSGFIAGLQRRMDTLPNYPNPATTGTGKWHFPVSMPA
jgi:hypothetical protein